MANTSTTTTTTAPTAPQEQAPAHYLANPFRFGRLADAEKDEQLRRFTLIFQSLAALATIIFAVYAFSNKG